MLKWILGFLGISVGIVILGGDIAAVQAVLAHQHTVGGVIATIGGVLFMNAIVSLILWAMVTRP